MFNFSSFLKFATYKLLIFLTYNWHKIIPDILCVKNITLVVEQFSLSWKTFQILNTIKKGHNSAPGRVHMGVCKGVLGRWVGVGKLIQWYDQRILSVVLSLNSSLLVTVGAICFWLSCHFLHFIWKKNYKIQLNKYEHYYLHT